MKLILNIRTLLAAGALLCVLCAPSNAQYPGYQPKDGDEPMVNSIANDYIGASVGLSGTMQLHLDKGKNRTDTDTWVDWPVSGGWIIYSLNHEAGESGENDITCFASICPLREGSHWIVRVGTTNYVVGDSATGSWYMYPYPRDSAPTGAGEGMNGRFLEMAWDPSGANVRVWIRIYLIRDKARFEVSLINLAKKSQNVGFAIVGDVQATTPTFNAACYDECEPYIPLKGLYYPYERANEMLFGSKAPSSGLALNGDVPDAIEIYDDLSGPVQVVRWLFNGEDATKPDYAGFCDYNSCSSANFWLSSNYTFDPYKDVWDHCIAACWEPKPLKPHTRGLKTKTATSMWDAKTDRMIITYYGLGFTSSKWTYVSKRGVTTRDSAVAAVVAPYSLAYDSSQIDANPVPTDYLYSQDGADWNRPDGFKVTASVYNTASDPGYRLKTVKATLTLPEGLVIDPTERLDKVISPLISQDGEASVSWVVYPDGRHAGSLNYSVAFSANREVQKKAWTQTVTRSIIVPATKYSLYKGGYQLVSIPFDFYDTAVGNILQTTDGTNYFDYWYYDSDTYPFWYYNSGQDITDIYESTAASKTYDVPTEPLFTDVTLGQAFWCSVVSPATGRPMKVSATPINWDLPSTAVIYGGQSVQEDEAYIDLHKGMNLIGCPFVYPVYWGQVLVFNPSDDINRSYSLVTAADTYRWLDRAIYKWNPVKGKYESSRSLDFLLTPWQGYYVKAYRDVTLILRAPIYPWGDVDANWDGS